MNDICFRPLLEVHILKYEAQNPFQSLSNSNPDAVMQIYPQQRDVRSIFSF